MRTIKFKGKKLSDGKWIFGDLATFLDGESKCICPRTYFASKELDDQDSDSMNISEGYALGEYFSVDPKTICQFTGFIDNNGQEIYEGDIVNDGLGLIIWCEKTGMFRVKWHHPTWIRIRSSKDNYNINGEPLFHNSHIVWKVVGNVHDEKILNNE